MGKGGKKNERENPKVTRHYVLLTFLQPASNFAVLLSSWPFRPQVEDLIDWKKAPDDPMFQLVFPQPDMLSPKDLQRSVSALQGSL